MKKGYKAFNKDFTCRGMKFEAGQTYTIDGPVQLCQSGFHYCENLFDVYNYYEKSSNTQLAEIEDLGNTVKEGDKSATNKIKIVRFLTDLERLDAWINRTNSGDWNSGYGNSGDRNSGDWNSGDGNSGYFNTVVPVYFFNKPSDLKYTKEFENRIRSLNVKPIVQWITSSSMTEQEQVENPSHKVTGGFLRKTSRHDFRYLTEDDKTFIKGLPNFDDKLFEEITKVSLDDRVTVIVNGVEKKISKADAEKLGLI